MKTLFLLLCFAFFSWGASAQGLKKYAIANSGCSLYSYCESKYKTEFSADSSTLFRGECVNGGVTYGVICVKLLNPVENLVMAEDLMISYVDYLKQSFDIKQAAGYGKGYVLNGYNETRGILDYWKDAAGDQWKITAWTDGRFIGFMYAYSKNTLPEEKVNAFLEGFRLPGM